MTEEAKIIKREEGKKHPDSIRIGLHLHRVNDVRSEQRATLLAYAYIRGRKYSSTERKSVIEPNWTRVLDMVKKYGPYKNPEESYKDFQSRREKFIQDFQAWKDKGV